MFATSAAQLFIAVNSKDSGLNEQTGHGQTTNGMAIREGTSLSAQIREFLRQYVEGTAMQEAQLRQAATVRLMDSIARVTEVSKPQDDAKENGSTLRDALYKDDFRQQARRAANSNRT